MIHQHVLNLVELCVQKGIRQAVISPGSRSAPLTLAVARHPNMQTRVVADERSAGFIALGLAQQLHQPVLVICTSGSAVYNLAPAVAEAYFQEIPLLIVTADRPKEWIHQLDGQTIYQTDIFGKHVKKSFELPADHVHPDATWFSERIGNEAINHCRTIPYGPVHLNVPLREPLYPTSDEQFSFGPVRVIDQLTAVPALPTETWHRLQQEWEGAGRKLIAIGQGAYQEDLIQIVTKISEEWSVPIIADAISNVPRNGRVISQQDVFLGGFTDEMKQELQPDLLITCGQSFLSKSFKQFLRQYPAKRHWHIQLSDRLADPFQSLTTLIPYEPTAFFEKLFEDLDFQHFREGDDGEMDDTYQQNWQQAEGKSLRLVAQFLRDESIFHEWAVVHRLLESLPVDSQLHVANSMPVRYVNLSGLEAQQRVEVFANRGTSGIDGCLSTAVGAALANPNKLITALIGDMAFFYDRNALWNAYVPTNLRIVLLNNHGGNIFRMIDGPSRQPELELYFETPQPLTAENTARDAGIGYQRINSYAGLRDSLATFFEPAKAGKLLEIETDRKQNTEQFQHYKQLVKQVFS
ncbi:2-succinyl-5-enolpyruvyl-6-hydroxy-3-cyclohexene-1-carboxylic-acid synthase [Tellurirhabdus bombi]|uniref:2-succinyl-5-enolpyruvyl-6-hydroxy-3- cyclohexene-1-carboxylic-acid synthase n=1 Tax=Tellurirhabdus bombi TaxID=2907205 RepID=UPI001F25E8EA|nr:2-succinyl-5-enolpyruvyl-6-hydroxy-3-cyclohexene-1-carboxylic-acid synthase [Tellurirhabdus bombi]